MSHALNELISLYNVKAVENEAKTAESIAEHSVRVRDALSRIEKAKEEWETEYLTFNPSSQEGSVRESRGSKTRKFQ